MKHIIISILMIPVLAFAQEKDRQLHFNFLISKADSCYFANDYAKATSFIKKALNFDELIDCRTLSNAACFSALSGDTELSMSCLWKCVFMDKDWYLNDPIDKDLFSLTQLEGWKEFNDTITVRRNRIEAEYDQDLIDRLKNIWKTDQDVRNRYIHAAMKSPQDTTVTKRLLREMQHIDSINLIQIKDILNTHGWPGKKIIGNQVNTIWLVIQHSDIGTQQHALPMLKEAAQCGELSPSLIAMLEDRILVNSGKKQIYGSQVYRDDNNNVHVFPISDPGNVNARRASVGLDTLEEYLEYMKKH